jgi:predicted permease
MDTLLHDVRFATRFLFRNRLFAAASAGILALGISLTATLFAIVNGALIEPWPYRGYDRIVTFRGTYPTQGRSGFSLWSVPEIDDLRQLTDVFEYVIAGDARDVNLTYAGRPERVRAAVITPNTFAMLHVPAYLGRVLTDADAAPSAAPVVVVSFGFWKTYLGADPRIVGETLRTPDGTYQIAGVMPQSFVFWDRDLWMPLRLDESDALGDRRYYVQAQLRPHVSLVAARARLRLFCARLAADHPDHPEYAGLGISINTLVDDVLRDLRPTLYLLLAAVGLVLLVAVANLANMTIAKATTRSGEFAVRRALGGTAWQLSRQLLVESGLIGVAGGLAGAAAAAFLLAELLTLIPFGEVPAEAHIVLDWRIVIAATVCAVGCGLLVGVAPAMRAAVLDPGVLLKQSDTRTGSRLGHRWRSASVAAQLALAAVVLGVAASAWSTLRAAVSRDPGYRAAGVWTARIALPSAETATRDGAATYARILDAVRGSAGITDVALASTLPVGDVPTVLVSPENVASTQRLASLDSMLIVVSPGFFRLLDVPLVEGRVLTDRDDSTKPSVVVVSRALARRLWPDGRAVGRRLTLGRSGDAVDALVVGVVGDVDAFGDVRGVRPAVFEPIAQRPPVTVAIAVRTIDPARALEDVDAAVRRVDPNLPVYEPEMLAHTQIAALGSRLLAVTVLGVFAAAVLAISAVGTYALVSQSVQERAQELRIRLTFGAEPRQLLRRELARMARFVALSVGAGSIGAIAALRVLSASYQGFAKPVLLPLAASAVLLLALSLVATAIPASQASRLDGLQRL